jgi:large subunit ribosomal protein L2
MRLYNLKIKKLFSKLIKKDGRNNTGKVVIRNRGGGHKYKYRIIDYKRHLYISAVVLKHENFRTHTGTIALIVYKNGILSYILSAQGLKIGAILNDKNTILPNVGSNLLIKHALVGSIIYNVEILPGGGGQLSRAGGTFCQVINLTNFKNKRLVLIKLKSKKYYLIDRQCSCVNGMVNFEFLKFFKPYKNAGKRRNLGIRPHVRGVAMNPIDHPHGGNTSGGRCSVSIYGVLAKGFKTKKKRSRYSHAYYKLF